MRKESTTSPSRLRRPNTGSFKPGHDSRRHQFTTAERVKGFWNALESLTVRYDDDRAKTFGKFLRREGRFAR
jgi:hypothetical protein